MSESIVHVAVLFAAMAAGGIASVTGFGIGSILTPLLAASVGMKQAVALVAIPHFAATLVRFWVLRRYTDRRVLLGFGLMNAAGALAGALLHDRFSDKALTAVLAVLLLTAGAASLSGHVDRIRFGKTVSWIAGFLSGAFGGLVGNQGSIRSAAMLGIGVRRDAFVATATAIALAVDCARLPVYLTDERVDVVAHLPLLAITTAGVLMGTLFGARLLHRIPERKFRAIVGVLLCLIAVLLLL